MSFSLPLRYLPDVTEEDLLNLSPYVEPVYSTRAKRFSLKVDVLKGQVKLVIPKNASLKDAYSFVADNLDWIEQRRKNLPDPILFKDGVKLPILGEEKILDIFYDTGRKTTKIEMHGNYLNVHTNKEDPTTRITRYLKDQARTSFSDIAVVKAAQIKKNISKISIRDTSSRWGSCTHDGHISLSWRLIFAPHSTIDYVIAHEVAHLKHMDHSPNFWSLCEYLSTDFETGRQWIKKNGGMLMRYGG